MASIEPAQRPWAAGYNNFRQSPPRTTFIVTTPSDRGKHHRGHTSTINANSALLRHARARILHARINQVADTRLQVRRSRNKRSLTANSGHSSVDPFPFEYNQHNESSYNSLLFKTQPYQHITWDNGLQAESSDCSDSGSDDSISSSTSSQHNLDKILQSTLDPFLQLPLDLSRHERSLLHFYLTDARTLVFGDSPRPVYDVAVYCASIMVEHCSLYAVVKLASAESILCRATGKALSPKFYSLRARAYSMMNKMLDNPTTSFFDRVEGFNQLGIMEMFLNHTTGQKQHLQAMWHYIETHGGYSRFLSNDRPHRGTLGIGVYSGNFVYVDMPILSEVDLDMVMSRFVSSLRRAGVWYRLQRSCSQHSRITVNTQIAPWKPLNLQAYLEWLISECLKQQHGPRHLAAGAFHSIYNLFMTPMILDYGSRDSRMFLQQIESCMQQRPAVQQEVKDIPELVSVSHIFQGINTMLYYVRSLLSGERQEAEVELCQSSVEALKVLPLLSGSSVLRLARDMIRCALIPVNNNGYNTSSFDEDYLQDLTWEAEKTWKSRFRVDKLETSRT